MRIINTNKNLGPGYSLAQALALALENNSRIIFSTTRGFIPVLIGERNAR